MRNTLFAIVILFYSLLIYTSCATQQPITGGPKDTIPPTLIQTIPTNKSINFRNQSITLIFDELIKENQLQTKLIITPDDQNKFDTYIKKNMIRLDFEQPFEDSTTYTINFNSSIEDITEGNDAENVILAFSTTSYIDSLAINGHITSLLSTQPVKDATVALYEATDTADIFSRRPPYFTKTDEDGFFSIENLKNGQYRIYSFVDDNKNNLCEADTEPHGFIADTLLLQTNIDSLTIPIIKNDVRPLSSLSTRVSGLYFESRYNKPIKDFSVEITDSLANDKWSIHANTTEDRRGIVFYPANNPKKDSLKIEITAVDSTDNAVVTESYLRFEPSKRSPQKFMYTMHPVKDSEVLENTVVSFDFNKPIAYAQSFDSLTVSIDSLFKQPLQVDSFTWNAKSTHIDIYVHLDKKIVPTQQQYYTQLKDSLSTDTASLAYKNAAELALLWTKVKPNYTRLRFPKGMFISIDGDSTFTDYLPLKFINSEEKGIIRGNISTSYPSYKIQLINKKYETVKEHQGTTNFEFKNVDPGDYSIRLLIDNNEDGVWSTGNSLKRIEPEKVMIYPEFFNVRANWVMENIDLQF